LIETLFLLAFLMVGGLALHHSLSTGAMQTNDSGASDYTSTLMSKALSSILSVVRHSHVLPPGKNGHICPRTKKFCNPNDHLGCKYFQNYDIKDNKVVCSFKRERLYYWGEGGDGGVFEFPLVPEIASDPHAGKIKTDIDRVASVLRKHRKVVFDDKLSGYLNIKPKLLHKYIECLERYNFVQMHMDPVNGMTIVWTDKSDLISNGYSKQFIQKELQNRRLDSSGLSEHY